MQQNIIVINPYGEQERRKREFTGVDFCLLVVALPLWGVMAIGEFFTERRNERRTRREEKEKRGYEIELKRLELEIEKVRLLQRVTPAYMTSNSAIAMIEDKPKPSITLDGIFTQEDQLTKITGKR